MYFCSCRKSLDDFFIQGYRCSSKDFLFIVNLVRHNSCEKLTISSDMPLDSIDLVVWSHISYSSWIVNS